MYLCYLFSGSSYCLSANDDLQAKLTFLEENIEPWSLVVEYWTETSKHRVTELHVKSRIAKRNKGSAKGKANIKGKIKSSAISELARQDNKWLENVSIYMNKYPALREKLGYTLVNIYI